MNLYLIQRTDKVDWDEYAGGVICASNGGEARVIAARELDSFWPDDASAERIWMDPAYSRLRKIGVVNVGSNMQPRVILADFRAG